MPFIAGRNAPSLRLAVLGLALVMASQYTPIANAQQRGTLAEQIQGRVKVSDESGFLRAQLRRVPGVTLAEGSNEQPVGLYQVTKYRIEELSLPTPIA